MQDDTTTDGMMDETEDTMGMGATTPMPMENEEETGDTDMGSDLTDMDGDDDSMGGDDDSDDSDEEESEDDEDDWGDDEDGEEGEEGGELAGTMPGAMGAGEEMPTDGSDESVDSF